MKLKKLGEHAIPAELLSAQWIIWKMVWNEEKQKYTKPPYSPKTGKAIGATEKYKDHFVDFDFAIAAAIKFEADGIGRVFLADDPYVGIDFDDCIVDGKLDPQVEAWLKWFQDAYVEVSPSGTGIHIICRAKIAKALLPTALPKTEHTTVEAYSDGRYFCFTAQNIGKPVATIGDCQTGIKSLLDDVGKPEPTADRLPPTNDKPITPSQLRNIYKEQLNKLRGAPQGTGNATLNNAALIAARVCVSGVFEKTEADFKKELLDIVTKEWSDPHPSSGARSTIDSGWAKGIKEGGFNVRQYPVAVSSVEYCAQASEEPAYIVQGMLYQGTASQLMGSIKAGKTTFTMTMIRKIKSGEDFIGQKTNPTNILYVTEQPQQSFQTQLAKGGLNEKHLLEQEKSQLYVLDLTKLWNINWEGRAETIRENAYKLDCGLVIIDTFSRIALIEDIVDAGEINKAFETIYPIIAADKRALQIVSHERKAGGSIFEAAAGSAAAGGAMDMLLRIMRAQGAQSKLNDRTRTLEMVGRLPTAFEEAVSIVLNNDMSDYAYQGAKKKSARKNTEQQILSLLPTRTPGVTKDELMQKLEAEAEKQNVEVASESTIGRALDQLVEDGLVQRTGEGGQGKRGGIPFRYYAMNPNF